MNSEYPSSLLIFLNARKAGRLCTGKITWVEILPAASGKNFLGEIASTAVYSSATNRLCSYNSLFGAFESELFCVPNELCLFCAYKLYLVLEYSLHCVWHGLCLAICVTLGSKFCCMTWSIGASRTAVPLWTRISTIPICMMICTLLTLEFAMADPSDGQITSWSQTELPPAITRGLSQVAGARGAKNVKREFRTQQWNRGVKQGNE